MGLSIDETNWLKLEIVKRAIGNPSYPWRNTYEINVTAPIDTVGAANIASAIMTAEANFHGENVEYVKAVMSSWEPEAPGELYDPETFVVVPAVGLYGQVNLDDPLPRNITLLVRRAASSGHNGKVSYRGVLGKAMLNTPASLVYEINPTSKSTLQSALTAFYAACQTAITDEAAAGSSLCLVRYADPPTNTVIEGRPISGLVVDGIRSVSFDHKYFDRAA